MANLIDLAEESAGVALPFEKNMQIAILGHLLTDDAFFLVSHGRISPDWFADPNVGKIYAAKVKFYKKYQRIPSINELVSQEIFLLEDAATRNKINELLRLAVEVYSREFQLDALSEQLTGWYHSIIFKKAMQASARAYNVKKPNDAYNTMAEAMKEISQSSFYNDHEEHFDGFINELEQNQKEFDRACTTGLPIFDQLLNPKLKGSGALLPGDTSIVLAPTNVGKTTSMITMIVHNILKGKRVLFITHEGRPGDIKEKVWRCILNVTDFELYEMYKTPEGRQRMENALAWIKRYLTYLPMNKAGLTVEEVASIIRKRQEEMVVKNRGKGYDLLVCDYPAKLTTQQAAGGHLPKRVIDEVIYNYFVQLGLEYNFHVLAAIQSNREGSKINKGRSQTGSPKEDNRLLTMEDVSESWGPMTSATNVWSINRDPHARAAGRLTYYIDKSRSSETGFAIVCKSDYPRARTHSQELGGAWYRGTSNFGERLDDMLKQNIETGVAQLDEMKLLGLT